MSVRQIAVLAASGAILLFLLFSASSLWEKVDAGEIMVVQSPLSGRLTWHTTPGVKWQGFGKVTVYHKRSQFWFSSRSDQGAKEDQSIKVRFNDGGHANISGSIAWEMPIDPQHLNELHARYGNQDAVQQQLVRTVVEKAVYMTGPLMSSKESYAERRNDLLHYIEDQVQNGVYSTETRQEKQPDPMTGQPKTVNIVMLVKGADGQVVRADESPLKTFGIQTFNPSINEVKYDDVVEAQIQAQQKAIMDVQTAVAEAKKAEQAAITAAKSGEAEAAKAKWEQEVIKAKAVTEAEQKLRVAELETKAAEQFKQAEILRGEGEAGRRRLVMEADGALEQKLKAYVAVNQRYAEAVEKHPGPWVPSIVMGGGNGQGAGTSGANQLIELLTVKTAKDLGLDLGLTSAGQKATASAN